MFRSPDEIDVYTKFGYRCYSFKGPGLSHCSVYDMNRRLSCQNSQVGLAGMPSRYMALLNNYLMI